MNVKTGVVTVSIIIITNNVVTGDDCIDQYQEVENTAGHAVIMSSQSCNKCHHCHTVFTINNVTVDSYLRHSITLRLICSSAGTQLVSLALLQ